MSTSSQNKTNLKRYLGSLSCRQSFKIETNLNGHLSYLFNDGGRLPRTSTILLGLSSILNCFRRDCSKAKDVGVFKRDACLPIGLN